MSNMFLLLFLLSQFLPWTQTIGGGGYTMLLKFSAATMSEGQNIKELPVFFSFQTAAGGLGRGEGSRVIKGGP